MYFQTRELDKAGTLSRQAAEVAKAQGCDLEIWARARIIDARSLRLKNVADNTPAAIDLLERDLAEVQRQRPDLAGLFHFHLGYIRQHQHDYWGALPHYEKARAAHEQYAVPVTKQSGQYLYKDLGNIYTRLGENEKAVRILQIALDSCLVQNDSMGVPDVHADLGIAYLDVGRIDSACLQYERGLHYIDQKPNPDPDEQSETRSMLLANWAEALLLYPDPDLETVRKMADEALALDVYNTSALIILGNVAAQQGRATQADALYRQAEAVLSTYPQPLDRELAKVTLQRAQLLHDNAGRPNPNQTLPLCQRALQHVLPAFQPKGLLENPPERLFYPENTILEALDLKSRILWDAYRTDPSPGLLAQADSTTVRALAMHDTLTSVYGFESSKLYSMAGIRRLHERYLHMLFEWSQRWSDPDATDRIAAFLEKSRALLLRQKLAGEYALQTAPISPDLQLQEQDLRRKLVYLKNEIAAEQAEDNPDQAALKKLEAQLFHVQEARVALLDTLKNAFPEYFEARYAQPVQSLAGIRELLRDSASLFVSYFYNPESGTLYSLGVTPREARLFRGRLPEAELGAFLSVAQDGELSINLEGDPAFLQQFVRGARFLYDTLLAPVAGGAPPEELILSPDGMLGSLPFDILLPRDPTANEQSFRQLPYLVRQTKTRFAASATVLRYAGALAARSGGKGYLGVAPGYPAGGFFAPVNHGEACIRDLAHLFNGQVILDARASRETFRALAPDFQVLHFYGHGSANGYAPELSYLAFAGGNGKGNIPDTSRYLAARANLPSEEASHVLFAHEISLQRLRAGLVVLSACETGVGQAVGSEGIFSLARAFQDAGCPSTAMTLWPVDDEATNLLTRLFLQNIHAGMTKDEALRQAKLSFLEQHTGSATPFFWSGMVLSGDASPLEIAPGECSCILGGESVACSTLILMAALLAGIAVLIRLIFRR